VKKETEASNRFTDILNSFMNQKTELGGETSSEKEDGEPDNKPKR